MIFYAELLTHDVRNKCHLFKSVCMVHPVC